MSHQIKKYSGKNSLIISNFIDEDYLIKKRSQIIISSKKELTFIGSITNRKNVFKLIKIFLGLQLKNVYLNIIGNGNELIKIKKYLKKFDLDKKVTLHGYLENPFYILSKTDIFILPSYSEGISRASLEALFFGIPCILRDVDGNNNIINEKLKTGYTFSSDKELGETIIKLLNSKIIIKSSKSKLPEICTQNYCTNEYLKLFNSKNNLI